MADFLCVDQSAAEAIISERSLQSPDFEKARQFVDFLKGDRAEFSFLRNVAVNKRDGGLFFIGDQSDKSKAIILDLEQSGLFGELKYHETLSLIQRLLRFAIRYWGNHNQSKNEKIIQNSTKAVVFSFPISTQFSFRVSVEREPDEKRLKKRERSGLYLLVYKAGVSEGGGGNEIAELANFRKAIAALLDLKSDLRTSAGQADHHRNFDALKVAVLPEVDGGLVSPFIACLSGCYPHPLNVGWAHSPE